MNQIPAAAVDAAAKALKDRCGAWDSWAVLAKTALEAAAPHMLAEAWEMAYELGYADRSVDTADTRINPCRSQS